MEIKLPEGLRCRWCDDRRLDLVDVWCPDPEFHQGKRVLVVMHCTWCNRMMESMAPIHDDVICPNLERRVWRSTHNEIEQWPYGDPVKVGHRREEF